MHYPEGEYPLQLRRFRPVKPFQDPHVTLPELCLWVGRDLRSSGATLVATEPRGARETSTRTLWAARWLEPVLTIEGGLQIMANSAAAALAELFGPQLPM